MGGRVIRQGAAARQGRDADLSTLSHSEIPLFSTWIGRERERYRYMWKAAPESPVARETCPACVKSPPLLHRRAWVSPYHAGTSPSPPACRGARRASSGERTVAVPWRVGGSTGKSGVAGRSPPGHPPCSALALALRRAILARLGKPNSAAPPHLGTDDLTARRLRALCPCLVRFHRIFSASDDHTFSVVHGRRIAARC